MPLRIAVLLTCAVALSACGPSTETMGHLTYPDGKTKALVLSYDDGPIEDIQLARLFDQYDLVGTFKLNALKTQFTYSLSVTGLADLTAAHFHNAAAGSTGGVVRALPDLQDTEVRERHRETDTWRLRARRRRFFTSMLSLRVCACVRVC